MSQNTQLKGSVPLLPAKQDTPVGAAQTPQSVGVLGRISVANKIRAISFLLAGGLLTVQGIAAIDNYKSYQHGKQSAAVAKAYEPLADLQLAIRYMRFRSPNELSDAQLKAVEQGAASVLAMTKATKQQDLITVAEDINTQLTGIVGDLRNKAIDKNQNFERSTAVLQGPIVKLYSELTYNGGLLDKAPMEGVNLTNISAQTLPDLLPSIGTTFNDALAVLRDVRDKQNGIATELQKEKIAAKIGEGRDKIHQLERSYTELFARSEPLKAQLSPELDSALAATNKVYDYLEAITLGTTRITADDKQILDTEESFLDSQYALFRKTNRNLAQVFQNQANYHWGRLISSLLGMLTVLAVTLTALYLVLRAILNPLQSLVTGAERLSKGDFTTKVPVTSQDELGTLARTLNIASGELNANQQRVEAELAEGQRMQSNIGEFLDVTMDIADGDLTKRGKVTEDVLGNVVDSINLMVEELSGTLKGVQNSSQSVASGSKAMLLTTADIEQGTLTTAEQTQRLTKQATEINEKIQEMARSAQASAEAARQALLAAQQGQEAVSTTLSGMASIRDSTQSMAERVGSLTQRSEQIQEILDSISHIASQTNLLSLHASIEAAGAGEAGSRFAVVADEVRQLADESTAATGRIAQLITELQAEIREVSASMKTNAQQVEQGYQVAGQAGERLAQIGQLSQQSAQFAQNISEAATEQVRGVQDMGQSVQQIAEVTERSQISVKQGRSAAEQLQALSQQLDQSLKRFRLPS